MNFLGKIKNALNGSKSVFGIQLVSQNTFNTFSYRGQVYRSDVVRSCIRPFANAISKLQPKHIREMQNGEIQTNPEPYIKLLLETPNPYMSMQNLLCKLAVQLKLNSNAFAYIHRDECGYPMQIYPIPAYNATAIYDDYGYLYIKFMLKNGKSPTFAYKDLIHLRQDFNENDVFGESPQEGLVDLMDIVATTDSGIKSAIKNGGLIKWLLKFKQQYKAEHLKREAKSFVDDYLKPDDMGNSSIAAAIDNKADIEQVKPNDYVPNATQMDKAVTRIYNFFGTNEKI
ncbi:MAG: phage portal protein, partial [Candidatus Gastranaerophilales bacterium]|nr:phage portal protein [Candidatus Gastranaerophilales bacterium]